MNTQAQKQNIIGKAWALTLFGHVGQSRGPLSAARRPRWLLAHTRSPLDKWNIRGACIFLLGASLVATFAGAAPFTASRVVHRGAGLVRHWVRWGDTIAISAAILLLSHKLSWSRCGVCWTSAVGLEVGAAFLGGCHVRAYQLNAHYATWHATGSFGAAPSIIPPAPSRLCMRVSGCCDQLHWADLAEFFNCAQRDSSVTLAQAGPFWCSSMFT